MTTGNGNTRPTPAQQRQSQLAPSRNTINIEQPASSQADLRKFLQLPQVQEQVAGLVPKHLTPERVTALMLSATLRTPKLMACNMKSILQGMITVAELGLEMSPSFGHLYMIPYENRKLGITELKIEIAYGGLAQLVYNATGLFLTTVPVYDGDPFVMREGSEPYVTHEVSLSANRTAAGLLAVYCRVEGQKKCELMTRNEVDDIRKRSKSANDGPWVTDYVQMARKSVLRRITKTLPKAATSQAQLARALEVDDEDAEGGEHLSAKHSIISSGSFSIVAPPPEAAPAQTEATNTVDGEQHDDNGVLPDQPPALPADATPLEQLLFHLQQAPDADAVRALKAQVDGFRGTPDQGRAGTAFAEAAKRVQR